MRNKRNWSLLLCLCISFLPLSQIQADTLKQVVSNTVETNPDVFIKLKAWLAAKEGISKARGGYLPTIDIGGNIGSNHMTSTGTALQTNNLNSRGVDATLTQMLFDGFATSNEVSRNVNLTLSGNYQAQGTADDVALLAIKSYLDVLRTQRIYEYAQENYDTHVATYKAIKRLAEQGLGSEAEATQAYGRLALAKANLLAVKNNCDDAKATYYKVVGKQPTDLKAPEEPSDATLPKSEDEAVKIAVTDHPTLKSAKADVEEARAQYKASKADFYPHIDGILSAAEGHDINGNEGKNTDYSAMVRVKYNIFKGGSDLAYKRQTAQLLEQAQQTRNRTYDQVVENTRLSWDFLKTNQTQLPYFKQHQESAKIAADAYFKQFQVGKRRMLDLLDVQDELFNAKCDYTNGMMNIVYSKYRLLNASGKVLSYLSIPIPSYHNNPKKYVHVLDKQPSTTKPQQLTSSI